MTCFALYTQDKHEEEGNVYGSEDLNVAADLRNQADRLGEQVTAESSSLPPRLATERATG